MQLIKLNPYKGCEALAKFLAETPLIEEEAITDAKYIYVGSNETSELPYIYIVLEPNGSVFDLGTIATYTVILELRVPLVKGKVNTAKIDYITGLLSDVISEPVNSIEGFLFSITQENAVGTLVDYNSNYSSTLININVKSIN